MFLRILAFVFIAVMDSLCGSTIVFNYGGYDLPGIKKQIDQIQPKRISFQSKLSVNSDQTIERQGVFIQRPQALGTVVICHGYLSNKFDALHFKQLFPQYNVLSFDFRAHGEDVAGQYSTIGRDEAFDVAGAVHYVRSHDVERKPVIAYGFSMGAVAAIEAQSKDGSLFDAMILDCPYDSTDACMSRGFDKKMKISVLGKDFQLPGKDFILKHLYDEQMRPVISMIFKSVTSLDSSRVNTRFVRVTPVESVKSITVPCFFIHCENDSKVPVKAVQDLYVNMPGFKRLWITQGRKHFGSYLDQPELYWYKVNKFLGKVFDGNLQSRRVSNIQDDRVVLMSS